MEKIFYRILFLMLSTAPIFLATMYAEKQGVMSGSVWACISISGVIAMFALTSFPKINWAAKLFTVCAVHLLFCVMYSIVVEIHLGLKSPYFVAIGFTFASILGALVVVRLSKIPPELE